MSATQVYLGFIIASALFIWLAVNIKKSWSGHGYSRSRYRRAFAFMLLASCFHASHAFYGYIFFADDIDNSPLRLLSFALIYFHIGCRPTPDNKPVWFIKNKDSDQLLLTPSKRPIENPYEEAFFLALSILTGAVFFALLGGGLLLAVVGFLFPGLLPHSKSTIISTLLIFSALAIYGMYKSKKKHGRIL